MGPTHSRQGLVSHKIMAGKQYLSNTEMQSYMPEILRRNDQKIQDTGGINAWNALSEDEKTRRDIQVICHSHAPSRPVQSFTSSRIKL
jgi:tryptophan synthase beta subunit